MHTVKLTDVVGQAINHQSTFRTRLVVTFFSLQVSNDNLMKRRQSTYTMMEYWIIVDNIPDIGTRAIIEFFKDYNPKRCMRLDGRTACVEFFTKDEARDAIQGTLYLPLYKQN